MFRPGVRKPQSGLDFPLLGGFGPTEAGWGWQQGSLLPAVHSHRHTRTRARAAQGVAPAWDLQNLALGPSRKRAARCRGCFHLPSEPGFQFSERLCFHPKRCCLLLFDLNILKDNRKQMKYISVLILRRESFGRLPGAAAGWIRCARMATFIWVTSTPI